MRKEASLKEWKKLYDLAEKYVKMKPWKDLTNDEMICVSFSEEDRAFFTVMGNGGMEYGFGMYVGDMAFREMQLEIFDPVGDEYSMYMQNCIVMLMDRKEEVPPEQMEVIQKLGKNYGKGRGWIYFQNHARGYFPYIPDQQDVVTVTRFLEKLIDALQQIVKIKPRGLHLTGHGFIHKLEQSEWKTGLAVWNQKELKKLPFDVSEKSVKSEAAKWKKLKAIWEVDIILMHSVVNDEKYDRPLYPYMLLVMNHSNGIVFYQNLLEPKDDPCALCQKLTVLMKEHGRPEKILVSGDTMKEILSALQRATGVPVEIDTMKHMKEFKEEFQKDFLNRNIASDGGILKSFGLKDEEIASLLEMAGVDDEKELIQMLEERARNRFSDPEGGVFFPAPENDDISFGNGTFDVMGDGYSDEEEIDWVQPKTMRERIRLIDDFFESANEFSEFDSDDYFELDEEFAPGMLDAEWSDKWEQVLGQCTLLKLKEMAKILGIPSEKKKAQLAAEVSGVLLEKPARVKELLSEEEKALMKRLRTMVNKQECLMSDEFSFSKETVISLAEKGLLDISFGESILEVFLTFMIPVQMKGLRL